MPWKLASFNLISILFIFKVTFLKKISTLKSLNLRLLLLNGKTLFSLEWCNSQRLCKGVYFKTGRTTVQLDHITRPSLLLQDRHHVVGKFLFVWIVDSFSRVALSYVGNMISCPVLFYVGNLFWEIDLKKKTWKIFHI